MAKRYVSFGEMCWPMPDTELVWKLAHAPGSMTRGDQLVLASIVSAYHELVMVKTQKRRNYVVREIRRASSSTRMKT